jgi:hypothetical protein
MLASIVDDIARAERRHPSAVLADIEGPAGGVGGRACEQPRRPWAVPQCAPMRLGASDIWDDEPAGYEAETMSAAPHGADEGSE